MTSQGGPHGERSIYKKIYRVTNNIDKLRMERKHPRVVSSSSLASAKWRVSGKE
jgi:hypothetical protein